MRSKLTAVLIIPSLAFLILAGAQTVVLFGQANVLGGFADQVSVGRQISTLLDALQRERDRTAGELAGLGAGGTDAARSAADLRPLHLSVDDALTRLREVAGPLLDGDAGWRLAYARADEALGVLPEIRAALPAAVANANTVLSSYNRAIDALLALLAAPSPGVEEPELTDAVLRHAQFARVKEIGSRIRAQLYAAGRSGGYDADDLVELTDLRAQQLTAVAEFRATATDRQIGRYKRAADDPAFKAATRLEETTFAIGDNEPAVLEPDGWWIASQQRQDLLREVETEVLDDAVDQAGSRSAAELTRTALTAGVVLVVLLAAILASAVIGRSIARSLRVLRGQALRVAQVELPETLERLRNAQTGVPQIEVSPAALRSMDEIGEVAEAFVAVHRSAVTVAVEQAIMRRNVNAMFVNLARRSQVLVERQLELLDELERDEGDPDQLENLFKLDHLAARMRRNDDSLLVLAGIEATRRWSRPVALSAVMLAAMAEIERYERVRHEADAHLHVVGYAVADLVHLLAELLENATSFSRPDTPVRVIGGGHGRDALIEVSDEGLGMSPEALAEANRLLAAPPAADVAASERMGLFVVSHLAARQGIRVQLRAAARGIVASVWLPAAVLAPAPAEEPATELELVRRPAGVRQLPLMLAGSAAAAATGPVVGPAGNGAGAGDRTVLVAAAGGYGPDPAGLDPIGLDPANLDPSELPVAGRRPDPPPRRPNRRELPTRSEDVLLTAGATAAPTPSTWWSRHGRGAGANSAAPPPAAPAAPTPPAVPVTGGVNRSGLPVRVPMAQLAVVTESARPVVPAPRPEPDPATVGGTLSRLYGGIRRAEAEETTEISMAPTGVRGERREEERS